MPFFLLQVTYQVDHEDAELPRFRGNEPFPVTLLNDRAHGFPGEATRKANNRVRMQLATLFLNLRGSQPLPR